ISRGGRIGKGIRIAGDVRTRQHVRLTKQSNTCAFFVEIRETIFRFEEQRIAGIWLMQNSAADAHNAPRDCGQCQQRDHIYLEALEYFGFGVAARCGVKIGRGAVYEGVQTITPVARMMKCYAYSRSFTSNSGETPCSLWRYCMPFSSAFFEVKPLS